MGTSIIKKLSENTASFASTMFSSKYKKAGVSWLTYRYYKYFSGEGLHIHQLFGNRTFFYGVAEYFHGLKEIFVDEIYNQDLPVHATVIDCGAHIGLSVLYIKKLCPSARVIAFEPDKRNFELLKENIRSHQLSDVTLRNEAVWVEDTELSFISDEGMSSKVGESINEGNSKTKAIRLRDLLKEKTDFLKIDIEGAEYAVLKDCAAALGTVKNMFIEYHGSFAENHKLTELINIIDSAGFSYYIKEATELDHPFKRRSTFVGYEVQFNIFCFRSTK